jgi:hypothetical protein
MKAALAGRTFGPGALGTCLAMLALATSALASTSSQYPPGPSHCCPDTLSIVNIQNPLASPHPVVGDVVLGSGGIITGFDTIPTGFAFYMQMSNGLPWTGVGVYTGKINKGPGTSFDFHLGDSVVVYAKVHDFEGGTGLVGLNSRDDDNKDILAPLDHSPATDDLIVRLVSRGNRLPDFHVGTLHELREFHYTSAGDSLAALNNTPSAEQWEGMLVRLRGPLKVARVSTTGGLCTDNSFLVVSPSCAGPVCDSVFVDGGTLAGLAPPPVGTVLDSVQGVFDQRSRGYRIQLRGPDDIVFAPGPNAVDAFPIYDNDLSGAPRVDSLMVVFDRPVEKASAEDVGHYALASTGTIVGAHRLDAPDDNRVVMEIHNGLSDGDAEAITVSGVKNLANGVPMSGPRVLAFVNGVLRLQPIQAPDPAYLATDPCQDRSRFAGAGIAPGTRLSFAGTVTGAFGGFFTLQDDVALRSGLRVRGPIAPLAVGTRYLFAGAVREFQGETEGTNNVYLRDLGTAPIPAAPVQSIRILRDTSCDPTQLFLNGEDYEGMLVTVERVMVAASQPAGASFFVASPGVVPAELIQVAADAGNLTFVPDSGKIVTITGVLGNASGAFVLYPVSEAYIEDFSASPVFTIPLDASKAATSSRDPDIALEASGKLFMVWGRNFHQAVHALSVDNSAHWTSTGSIPRQGIEPAVALADSNKLCVLTVGADSLLFHQSMDGGFQMDPVLTVLDAYPTAYPALTAGAAGKIHAAWQRDQQGIFYARSSSGGASFSPPIPIALDTAGVASNTMVRICASRGDSVYVFWQYERPGEPYVQKVLFSRSLDGGATFSAPRGVIDQANPISSVAKLTILGDAHVDANGAVYVMGTMDGPIDSVIFLRSTDGGARFGMVGRLPLPGEGSHCPKSFAIGSHGDVHAILAVCGVANYYTRSDDGGRTWSAAGDFTSSSGPVGEPRGAKVILDATGTPVVVWFGTVGGSTEIYSARLLH